jgi:hypothetical protein
MASVSGVENHCSTYYGQDFSARRLSSEGKSVEPVGKQINDNKAMHNEGNSVCTKVHCEILQNCSWTGMVCMARSGTTSGTRETRYD